MDSAVLLVARDLGLFDELGVPVVLTRETGCAAIREKLVHGELDSVIGNAGLLFSAYQGWNGVRQPFVTGLMVGYGGGEVVLSNALRDSGVCDARSLGQALRTGGVRRSLTLAVGETFSLQHLLLRRWLLNAGLSLDARVRLTVMPAPHLPGALRSGHVDGFLATEPWTTMAVQEGSGFVPADARPEDPGHPDGALIVSRRFADECDGLHVRLVAALVASARYSNLPGNRGEVSGILVRSGGFGSVPRSLIEQALVRASESGAPAGGEALAAVPGPVRVGPADRKSAARVHAMVRALRGGGDEDAVPARDLVPRLFRSDVFDRAAALSEQSWNLPPRTKSHPQPDCGIPTTSEPRHEICHDTAHH